MVSFTLQLFGGPRDGERLSVPDSNVRRVDLIAVPDLPDGLLEKAPPDYVLDPAQRVAYVRVEEWQALGDGVTFVARAEVSR